MIVFRNSNATALFTSIPQGTSWFIDAGTYIGVILINQSQTSITGSGVNSTIIKCPSGIYQNCIQAVGTAETLLTNIQITNLTVDGQWDFNATNPPQGSPGGPYERQQNGLSLQYVSDAFVERVKAFNTPWNGIQAYECQNVTYRSCLAERVSWHGLQFWSNTINSKMEHCSVNGASGGVTSEFGSNDNTINYVVINDIGFGDMTWGGNSGVLIGYNVHNVEVSHVQVTNSPFGITFWHDGIGDVFNLTLKQGYVENCTYGLYFCCVSDRISASNVSISNSLWNNLYSVSSSDVVLLDCAFINSSFFLDSDSNQWNITDCAFQDCPITNYGEGTNFYVSPTPTPTPTPAPTPTPMITLTEISVTTGGDGYTTPAILLEGGGGTGATATARVSNGVILGIMLTNTGSGYTSPPRVVIRDPSPRAKGATATVNYTNP